MVIKYDPFKQKQLFLWSFFLSIMFPVPLESRLHLRGRGLSSAVKWIWKHVGT